MYLSDNDDLLNGPFAATWYVPFPHPDGQPLCAKFPEDMSRGKVDELLEHTKWYMKIPYIGPSLDADAIKSLCIMLPALLEKFRQGVKEDVNRSHELAQLLPEVLISALKSIR